MSFSSISVPNNLLGFVDKLISIAETEPLVADHIAPILEETVSMALASGQVSNPDVWIRALKAAAILVETKKADDTWLSASPVRGKLTEE